LGGPYAQPLLQKRKKRKKRVKASLPSSACKKSEKNVFAMMPKKCARAGKGKKAECENGENLHPGHEKQLAKKERKRRSCHVGTWIVKAFESEQGCSHSIGREDDTNTGKREENAGTTLSRKDLPLPRRRKKSVAWTKVLKRKGKKELNPPRARKKRPRAKCKRQRGDYHPRLV